MRPRTLFHFAHFAALATFALVGAAGWGCSSSSTSPGAAPRSDGGAEATTTGEPEAGSDAGVDCGFATAHNEAGCPATYSTASLPASCSPIGLECEYPGQGDGTGCSAATAGLFCVASDADAGGDAGAAGTWRAAQ